ncbi:serine-rich adhesin for platelets-like [Clytia hemisphaerica]|uniref:serine-rich adhesin for platelets-like n=1 Tax=Clytia hemisphaerica TaxID=252671 RepID=UPI0034D4A873
MATSANQPSFLVIQPPRFVIYKDVELTNTENAGGLNKSQSERLIRTTVTTMQAELTRSHRLRTPSEEELTEMAKALVIQYPSMRDDLQSHETCLERLQKRVYNDPNCKAISEAENEEKKRRKERVLSSLKPPKKKKKKSLTFADENAANCGLIKNSSLAQDNGSTKYSTGTCVSLSSGDTETSIVVSVSSGDHPKTSTVAVSSGHSATASVFSVSSGDRPSTSTVAVSSGHSATASVLSVSSGDRPSTSSVASVSSGHSETSNVVSVSSGDRPTTSNVFESKNDDDVVDPTLKRFKSLLDKEFSKARINYSSVDYYLNKTFSLRREFLKALNKK